MGRQRKYRAWDEDNEVMYYSDAGWNKAHPESEDCIFDFHEGHVVAWLRETEPQTLDAPAYDYGEPVDVEEYTGLKDNNGTEIYEGDVIQHRAGDTWVVEFEYGEADGWAWQGYSCFCKSEWGQIKIIGNIHEHPNLLK